MARALGVLVLVVTILVPTLAQQKNEQNSDGVKEVEKPAPNTEIFTSPTLHLPINGKHSSSLFYGQLRMPLLIDRPKLIVKDGVIHLSIFEGTLLVPMPGGGGSGCYSIDLPERIEKLKNLVFVFPPLPTQSTAKSQ